jgi:hypothetical protein
MGSNAKFWSWLALVAVVLIAAFAYYRLSHPHVITNPYITK